MTSILLITDSERVQRIFRALEREDVLQLRVAATLAQSELGLAEAPVDFIFAQSRISGFSSDLALRHLQEGLPAATRTVLLAVDSQDAAQARKQGRPYFDLAVDDMTLVDRIRKLMAGARSAPGTGARDLAAPAPKKRAARDKKAAAVAGGTEAVPAAALADEAGATPLPARESITEKPAPIVVEEVATFTTAQVAAGGDVGKAKPEPGRKRRAAKEKEPPLPAEARESGGAAAVTAAMESAAEPAHQAPVPEMLPPEKPAQRVTKNVTKKSGRRPLPELVAAHPEEPSVEPLQVPVSEGHEEARTEVPSAPAEGRANGARPSPKEQRRPARPHPGVAAPHWLTEEHAADQEQEAREWAAAGPVEESPELEAEEDADSFAEVMRRAAANRERAAAREAAPLGEGPVAQPAQSREVLADGEAPQSWAPLAHLEAQRLAGHPPIDEALAGQPEPLTNGMLRAESRSPRWLLPLVIALVLASAGYFAGRFPRDNRGPGETGKKAAPPAPASMAAPNSAAAPPSAKPTPAPAAHTTPAAGAAPSATTSAVQRAKPVQAPAATTAPAKPAAVPRQPPAPASPAPVGLKALPPFMAGVRVDPAYARSHPGWQRFLGARGEYKIYREGDVYRALQIIALPDQSISDDIYQRALLEFGGIDSYFVRSSEKKGSFLVEHGEAKNGVGLTIYRKKKDLSMKGLVIFYR